MNVVAHDFFRQLHGICLFRSMDATLAPANYGCATVIHYYSPKTMSPTTKSMIKKQKKNNEYLIREVEEKIRGLRYLMHAHYLELSA